MQANLQVWCCIWLHHIPHILHQSFHILANKSTLKNKWMWAFFILFFLCLWVYSFFGTLCRFAKFLKQFKIIPTPDHVSLSLTNLLAYHDITAPYHWLSWGFLARDWRGLPSTYPTLWYKEIQVYKKTKVVPTGTLSYKKLSYRRGTARCVVSIEILPIATQQCRNYLYDKSWPNRWYEVGDLVGGNAW